MSLTAHVFVCARVSVCVCVRVRGSPRGLPQAYHTQAVRDELPERERGREKGRGDERKGGRVREGGG